MKQPWLRFYTADWRSKPALRMCSLAARGLWMDMLCLMHAAEPCGSLVVGGQAPNVDDLAGLINANPKTVRTALAELEERNVFSRDADGTIFSRRMRRDTKKAADDKANGGRGGNPKLKVVRNV